MKKQDQPDLTLRQQAIAHGYDTLADLADKAAVSRNCIYFANQGRVPKADELKRIAAAMSSGPRPSRFSAEDVLRAIAAGREHAERRVLEELG
jgi:hypothetical protein